MLLLKNYNRRRSGEFQPRRRNYDAFSSSESELSDNEPEIYSDLDEDEEHGRSIKSKIHDMNNAKLHRYFTPTKKRRERTESLVPENYNNGKKGRLESQRLDIKQIESRKKIDIIWNAIIAKYSAFDESNQGDVVNLEDFSIEEDTGHIKKLQNFQRTSIWNDINELEDQDGYEEEEIWDPSEDPINLLTRRDGSISSSQPQFSTKKDSISLVTPKKNTRRSSPIRTKTTKLVNFKDDPISLLTPRKTTRVSTRVPSPSRPVQRMEMPPPATVNDDPIALLTPRKTSRIPSRPTSPIRRFDLCTRFTNNSIMAPPPTPKRSIPTTDLLTRIRLMKRVSREESRGRTMERTGHKTHSSPVRQLMATLPNLSQRTAHLPTPTIGKFPNRVEKIRERKFEKHSSPVRRLMRQIDPINLLTPCSSSRNPTRQSSPLRSHKRARLTPRSLSDDPISLLTPRSSGERGGQYGVLKEAPTIPPPKFGLQHTKTRKLNPIEEISPFIDPELQELSNKRKRNLVDTETLNFFKKTDLIRKQQNDYTIGIMDSFDKFLETQRCINETNYEIDGSVGTGTMLI